MKCDRFLRSLWRVVLVFILPFAGVAHANEPIRVACFGEQTTHSFHRENDPEYPQFLGELLDGDFKIDATAVHPMAGGFLYGGGSHFWVGNFGHPRGTVLDHELENPKSILRSTELKLAEAFAPHVVILGPFGDHESQTKVTMDGFTRDLGLLIDRITAFTSKPVIFVALPLPRGIADDDENYRRILNETKQLAQARTLPVIDLWSAFLGQKQDFKDPTHLTLVGRQHLARIVADTIIAWETGAAGLSKP